LHKVLTKMCWLHFGRFLSTNPSGHPVAKLRKILRDQLRPMLMILLKVKKFKTETLLFC
jgi:hypothetical protein